MAWTDGPDYDKGAEAFQRARQLPDDIMEAWGHAVVDLNLAPGGVVLDLGAGTGQFVRPLSEWLEATVVAVEPSPGMRERARRGGATDQAEWLAARAEDLPLVDATIDTAWLSTVVHQLELYVAAGELARVVRPGGSVLIRGYFSHLPLSTFLAAFPGAKRAAAHFPRVGAIVDVFGKVGFSLRRQAVVDEVRRGSVSQWIAQTRAMRSIDSFLRQLTDDEIDRGIAELRSGRTPDDVFEHRGQLLLIQLDFEG